MIEIESRWDGKVLYKAESAADVRAALVEAVKSRANLYGANLSRADLSRANLYGANLSGADLYGADLYGADLSRANLSGANLSGADLYGADLYGANLYGANLSRADLYGANLSRADLSGAAGVNKHLTTPLYLLLDQPGKVRAYKLVTAKGLSPIQTSAQLSYEIGATVSVDNASTDEREQCAAGVNVATLDWCVREWRTGYRILVVEFTAADIAAIPVGSDGKFRVHRCKVVAEKTLADLGLADSAAVGEAVA